MAVQISVGDLKGVRQDIQGLIASMKVLDSNMTKLQQSSSSLDKLFGSAQGFRDFVTDVNKLKSVNAKGIESVGVGLNALVKALSKVNTLGPTATIITNIVDIIRKSFDQLRTIDPLKKELTRSMNSFQYILNTFVRISDAGGVSKTLGSDLLQFITEIGNSFSRINALGVLKPDVLKSVSVLNKIFSAFATVDTKASTKNLSSVMTEVINTVGFAIFELNKLPPLNVNIIKSINAIRSIFTSLTGLNTKTVDTALVKISIKTFKSITKDLVDFATNFKDLQSFSTISTSFESLNKGIQIMSEIDFSKFSRFKSLKAFVSPSPLYYIDNIVTSLNAISTKLTNTGNISQLGTGIKSLISAIDILLSLENKIPQNPGRFFSRLFRFGKSFTAIGYIEGIASRLSFLAKNLENIGNISTLATALKNVADAINLFTQLADRVPQGVIARFTRFIGLGKTAGTIRYIGFFATQISIIAQNLTGLEEFKKLGSAIHNVATAINMFSNLSSQIPQGLGPRFARFVGLGKVAGTLRYVGYFVSNVGKMAQNLTGLENLATLGKAMTGVMNFVNKIGQIDTKGFEKAKKPMEILAKVLKPLFNSLKSLKGVVVPDFKNLLGGLGSFAKAAQNVNFKNVDLSGFLDFIKNLSKGLGYLNKVTLDETKISSISKAMTALSKITSIKSKADINVSKDVEKAATGAGGARAFAPTPTFLDMIRKGFAEGIGKEIFDSIKNVFDNLTSIGQNLVNKFGLGHILQTNAFQAAQAFEDLSVQLKVYSGLQGDALKDAQNFANEIGIKYPLSSNQALQAIVDLNKAGLELPNIKQVLPSAADLAALSGGDLQGATKALIGAANGFKKFTDTVPGSYQTIATATNVLSAAADATTASVQEINEGIANTTDAANRAGLSYEQTAAALGILNDRQIKGADAGTALKSALNGLTSPKAREELVKLGVALYNTDGSTRDFDLVLKDINKSFKDNNFTQKQVNDSLSQLSETYGRGALSALLASNGISDMVDKMRKVAPASERAMALLESLTGQIEQLKGSAESLSIRAFLPLVDRVFKPMVKVARSVVDFFGSLPDPILETAVNVGVLVATFASLVGTSLIVIGTITRLSAILLRGAGIFLFVVKNVYLVVASFGALVTAAAAVITAIVAVGTILITVSAIITSVIRKIERNVGGAGDAFARFKKEVSDTLSVIGGIAYQISEIFTMLFGDAIAGEATKQGKIIAGFFDGVTTAVGKVKAALLDVATVLNTFRTFLAFDKGIKNFEDDYYRLLGVLQSSPIIKSLFGEKVTRQELDRFFIRVKSIINRLVGSFKDISTGLIGSLFNVEGAKAQLQRGVGQLFSTLTTILERTTGINLFDVITQFDAGNIEKGISILFGKLLEGIRNFIGKNAKAIGDLGANLFTFFFNPLSRFEFISNVLGLKNLAQIFGAVNDVVRHFVSGIVESVAELFAGKISVGDFVKKLGDTLGRAFAELPGTLGKIIQGIGNILQSDFLQKLGQAFINGDLSKAIPLVGQGLLNLLRGAIDFVLSALGSIGQSFGVDSLRKVAEGFRAGASLPEIVALLANGLKDLVIKALGQLPNLLRGAASLFNLPVITDFVNSLSNIKIGPTTINLFDMLANSLGKLIALPFNAFNGAFKLFQKVLNDLSHMNPGTITLLVTVLTSLAYVSRAQIVSFFGQFASKFSGFVGSIKTLVSLAGKFAAVIVILNLINALIDTANRVGKGNNPLGILGNTIKSFFQGILETLGASDQIIISFQKAFAIIQLIMDKAARSILQFIERLFRDAGDRIILQAEDLRARGDHLLGFATGFHERQYFEINDALAQENGQKLLDTLGNAAANPTDLAVLQAQFRTGKDKILGAIQSVFDESGGDFNKISDSVFNNILLSLKNSGGFSSLIDQLGGDPLKVGEFFNRALKVNPDLVKGLDLNDVFHEITTTVANLDPEKVEGFTSNFSALLQELVKSGAITQQIADEQLKRITDVTQYQRDVVATGLEKENELKAETDAATASVDELKNSAKEAKEAFFKLFGVKDGSKGTVNNIIEGVQRLLSPQGISDVMTTLTTLQNRLNATNQDLSQGGNGTDTGNAADKPPNITGIPDAPDLEQQIEDLNDIKDKYDKEEKRKLEDDLAEEQKAKDKIKEVADQADQERLDKIAKYNIESARLEEDHRMNLLKIDAETADSLEDAISSRDAAAAQRAVKDAEKKKADENANFDLAQKRRQEDFDRELADDARKRQASIDAAQKDYDDLVAKNIKERKRRLEDYQDQLNDQKAKNDKENQTYAQHNQDTLAAATTGLNNIKNQIVAFGTNAANALSTIFSGFATGSLQNTLANLGTAVQNSPIGQTVSGVIGALGTLTSAGSTIGGAGQSSSGITATQFAKGGAVRKGRLIEVSEPKTGTELYHAGDRTFMIPGANGYIQPPAKGNPYGSAGNQNLTISLGGITINGGNADANELVAKVEQQVIPKITQAVRALQR